MLFGERLTIVRKKKKISQDELAKAIGVHAPVIGRYERDEVKPSIEVAAKIAQSLGVSLDYLTGNSDLELDADVIKKKSGYPKAARKRPRSSFLCRGQHPAKCKSQKSFRCVKQKAPGLGAFVFYSLEVESFLLFCSSLISFTTSISLFVSAVSETEKLTSMESIGNPCNNSLLLINPDSLLDSILIPYTLKA